MQAQRINPAALGGFEFAMNDGRRVWLRQIFQWRTYGGLLCGYPQKSMNENRLADAKENALVHFGDSYPITVLEPEVTAYDYPPTGREQNIQCEAFPSICAAAVFDSAPTSRDNGCNSSATIVWFQHEWGPPNLKIQQEIAVLNWDKIACDWMW